MIQSKVRSLVCYSYCCVHPAAFGSGKDRDSNAKEYKDEVFRRNMERKSQIGGTDDLYKLQSEIVELSMGYDSQSIFQKVPYLVLIVEGSKKTKLYPQ